MSGDDKIRYRTAGGALVELTLVDGARGRWNCTGCQQGTFGTTSATTARQAANAHANDCRALPNA